jgi:hypothetical protein
MIQSEGTPGRGRSKQCLLGRVGELFRLQIVVEGGCNPYSLQLTRYHDICYIYQ